MSVFSVSAPVNKTKISDLVECYKELLAGVPLETLYEKYVRADVMVALELKSRGVSIEQFEDFIKKRNEHIKTMLGEKEERKRVVAPSKKVIL